MSSARQESSATVITLDASSTPGIYHSPYGPLSKGTVQLTNTLLSRNHEAFHIYFNNDGFHNHIVHHQLSLYALHATPTQVQEAFDNNASYQRSLRAADPKVVAELQSDRTSILNYLPGDDRSKSGRPAREGSGTYYPDLLEFWRKEIDKLGVKGVLQEWVFKGDDVAEKIFGRLFAGFLHPLIHLGFALEFHQPAIVAESLAQACVHENWLYPMICSSESTSSELKAKDTPPHLLNDVLIEARGNKILREAPQWNDANKVRDGVLARAKQEMIDVASKWFVPAHPSWDTIEEKVAEHIHASFLFTSIAAFHTTTKPDGKAVEYEPRLDFFYVHDTNSSIFYTSFVHDQGVRDLIGKDGIVRLLQVKVWVDIAMYVSRGSPAITSEKIDKIKKYETKIAADRGKGWERIFERACSATREDGHIIKFIRALANAQQMCQKYEDKEWCVIKGDMWERMGWVAVDSLNENPTFVRNAGWDKAWIGVPELK